MKISIPISILLLCSFLSPQFFDTNQYPPGIDWRYIDSEFFRIVFPAENTEAGLRVANTLDYIYPKISARKIGNGKITLLLPNCGIFSNGYIKLAPQKGEFFSTPPQSGFIGNTEWYSALSIHEGKHIDQFNRTNSGFTKLGGIIFGDLGRLFLSFFSIPAWFWEGEAVHAETVFSSGGRGRLPSFSIGMRSILLSGKKYKYEKSYLSSYKDYIPNIYRLGYFLITYLKNNLSSNGMENILKHSSAYSFYPLIFSSALKKESGLSVHTLYKKTMDELKKRWENIDKGIKLTNFKEFNLKPKNGWTLFTSPIELTNGSIISQKYGLSVPLSLVITSPEGKEKKITQFSTISHINNMLSVRNNCVVWSEPVKDIRWGKRSYAEIVKLNIISGEKKRITKKTRYFSPALSHDGKLIATVHFSKERKSSLVILRSSDGKKIKEYDSPDNSFLITPSWDDRSENIVIIRVKNGERSITLFNLKKGNFTDILTLSKNMYSTPIFFNDYILYGSPYSGIDNIYAVNISSGEQYRITSSRFGAFFPSISIDRKKIIYSDYNVNGTDIVSAPINISSWEPLSEVVVNRTEFFKKSNYVERKDLTIPKNIPQKKYKIKKYNHFKDIINFHSRVIIPDRIEPAFEMYSNNLMNTIFITGGYLFNTNEKRGKFYANMIYSGLFPVIKIGFSRGGRNSGNPHNLKWDETKGFLSVLLPFNFSKGVYNRKMSLESEISTTKISGNENKNGIKIKNGSIDSLKYRFSFSSYKHYAKRDITPNKGIFLFAEFAHTPWNTLYRGQKLFIKGSMYFPGIFRHNSLRLSISYEKQVPKNFIFSSNINFSRGYNFKYSNNLMFANIDYSFPILYPDLAIGDLLYLKRIRGTIFLDLGKGYNNNSTIYYNSTGVEIKGDINLFSLPLNLEAGIRISHRFQDNSFIFEPIFLGINF